MDRKARLRRLFHGGVAIDVIGVAVRVQDLHEPQPLLSDGFESDAVAHGGIDEERIAAIVHDDVAAVVVWRDTPFEDPHGPSVATKVASCARSRSRAPRRRSPSRRAGPRSSPRATW